MESQTPQYNMMLCKACASIRFSPREDKESLGETQSYLHSPNLKAIIRSAGRGCYFCHIIALEMKNPRNLFGGYAPARAIAMDEPVWILHNASEEMADGCPESLKVDCNEESFLLRRNEVSDMLSEFTIPNCGLSDSSTGSPQSLKLALYWFKNCISNHPNCTAYCGSEPSILPTRVIDVQMQGRSLARLVTSQAQRARYIALSHCWGSSPIFTTTSKNIAKLQSSIPIDSLPLTFQHAIEVTRTLGFRYLWIDSLCIIQDSPKDWEIESSRMGQVYRRAAFTISVTQGKDGGAGCFSKRDPLLTRPFRLPLQIIGDDETAHRKETFWSKRYQADLFAFLRMGYTGVVALRKLQSTGRMGRKNPFPTSLGAFANLWGTSGRRCHPPEKYVAPSWSWASVFETSITTEVARKSRGGLVSIGVEPTELRARSPIGDLSQQQWATLLNKHYDVGDNSCGDNEDVHILEVDCVVDGCNQFGQLKGGRLRLMGWVKLAKIGGVSSEGDIKDLIDFESGELIGGFNYDEDPGSSLQGRVIWCLFVQWHILLKNKGTSGLALLPTGYGNNECQRIGLAGMGDHHWKSKYQRMTLTIV
ncbi:heterokaryon incompatibility protein [Fusarium heterosporum]|uniref:Heterokaryon incompatibility protein n=1 Tax=Fusarium heterosporum TaxID=42747 RepID=A0A8H5X315_FUSHE|nr:heterokaryon incompatibility protein [Fusarium heterosporum]